MLIIDVSNVNGPIDWTRVSRAGIHAAFVKASEGVSFDDPVQRAHRAHANQAGIHVGMYHFARPDHNSARDEARHFARVVGSLGKNDLRPVLDLEVETRISPSVLVEWSREFNHRVRDLLGVWPLFYSYPAYIEAMRASRPIGAGLWLASYGRNDGREHSFSIPRPWKKAVAHQFTSRARIPGVGGFVDVSSAPSLRPLLAHPVVGTVAHFAHSVGGSKPVSL